MERRVFIAILLSFAVLYGYQALFVPPQKPAVDVVEKKERPPVPAPEAEAPVAPEPPRAPEPAAQIAETSEREIVLETTTSEVVLTNRGGRILHWRLKDYRDSGGALVDLVPSGVPPDQPRPFSLIVEDPALTTRLNGVLFRATGDVSGRADATRQATTVSFEYQDAAGLHVRKDYRFDPKNYVVAFSASVMKGEQALNPTVAWD